MFERINRNLHRQVKAMEVLRSLLAEEFELLKGLNPQAVTGVEFSIQMLLQQLAAEREEMSALLGGGRLLHYAEALAKSEPEKGQSLMALFAEMDGLEQECAARAEKNSHLALGLMDQSRSMLEFLHNQVLPESKETYSAKGAYTRKSRPDAAIIRGRL